MSVPPEIPRDSPAKGHGDPLHRHRKVSAGTPQAQVFVWLAAALLVVGMMTLYFYRRASVQSERGTGEGTRRASESRALPASPSPEELAARDIRLHTLFEGSLADTRNGEGFVETPGYRHLLQILASYPEDQVEALAKKKLDRDAVLADPDAWRGEFVWTRGVVAMRYANRLREPIAGAEDVYQVILTEGNGEEGVIVDMLGEPPPVEAQKDAVDVLGIFYRTVSYENADKRSRVLTVPYLLAKTLRPVEKPRGNRMGILRDPTAFLLVALALALAAGRLLIYVIQRRPRRPAGLPGTKEVGFRKMFEKSFEGDGPIRDPRSKT